MTECIKKPRTSIFTGQTGCGKTHFVLELIEKMHSKKMIPIILRSGSKTMIKFDLYILRIISIDGLKSCQNCYDS